MCNISLNCTYVDNLKIPLTYQGHFCYVLCVFILTDPDIDILRQLEVGVHGNTERRFYVLPKYLLFNVIE